MILSITDYCSPTFLGKVICICYENLYVWLQGLIDEISDVLKKRKENEELDTELTRTDIIKCIQSEKVRFRGLNLSGLDLSKLVIISTPKCLKKLL